MLAAPRLLLALLKVMCAKSSTNCPGQFLRDSQIKQPDVATELSSMVS